MKSLTTLFVVSLVVTVGCARQAEPPAAEQAVAPVEWVAVDPEQLTDEQQVQHERSLAAVNSLASEMMGELVAAMDSGGPTEAIGVCRDKAPGVAANVSGEFGLRIGRTSFALRNPSNLAPAWAENLVAEMAGEPRFLAGPTGEYGALLPIKLRAECQMCHGPAEMIDDDVKAAIAEFYPEDQATGFAEGDLRGWFWVEVPPVASETEV